MDMDLGKLLEDGEETGKLFGMLQPMGLQRVGHHLVTEHHHLLHTVSILPSFLAPPRRCSILNSFETYDSTSSC